MKFHISDFIDISDLIKLGSSEYDEIFYKHLEDSRDSLTVNRLEILVNEYLALYMEKFDNVDLKTLTLKLYRRSNQELKNQYYYGLEVIQDIATHYEDSWLNKTITHTCFNVPKDKAKEFKQGMYAVYSPNSSLCFENHFNESFRDVSYRFYYALLYTLKDVVRLNQEKIDKQMYYIPAMLELYGKLEPLKLSMSEYLDSELEIPLPVFRPSKFKKSKL
jgi:hypothetical protein